MNCRACRIEIEDARTGEPLSEQARVHTQACSPCRTFLKERLALRQLVGALEAVSAPPDFDFRLRARLAAVKSANEPRRSARRGFAPSQSAIALAASFALIIAAAVAFKQMTSTRSDGALTAEVAKITAPIEVQPQPVAPTVTASSVSDSPRVSTGTLNSKKVSLSGPTIESRSRSNNATFTGVRFSTKRQAVSSGSNNTTMSADFAAYNAQPGIMQPGKSSPVPSLAEADRVRNQTPDPFIARGAETVSLSPKAATDLGARGGRLVVSVRPESAASLSGLRAGDVIESVDGRLLTDTDMRASLNSNPPAPLSLVVVRGRQKLQINLQK